jgi:hypothetical protein
MMQRSLVFFFLALAIVTNFCGCANPRQIMVNPNTWQQTVCAASGFSWGAISAYSMYNTCVNNQRVLGMSPLEEVEAKDAPKFDMPFDATGKQATRPEWQAGQFWEYSLSSGGTRRLTVQKIGNYNGTAGYHVVNADGKESFYDQSLGLMVVFGSGIVDTEYDPALRPFDFPLFLGKSWNATGDMHRAGGHINLSNHHEVKGYGRVKVPAGEYDAFYILNRSDYGARISELWYSPEVKNYVKGVLYTNNGKIVEELSRFKLGQEKK